MSGRHLLTDEERVALFGVPTMRDALAKLYTLDAAELEFVLTRRTPANRLGFAAVLALLRHPGLAPSAVWPPPEPLVAYLAEQLGIDRRAFDDYARRPQTVGDFTLEIAMALGLRAPTRADVPFMVEVAARAAWPTERGPSIVEGLVASLREARLILPSPDAIERAGLAGRARARKRAANALLTGLLDEQLAKLDAFVAVDSETGRAPLTWTKDVPSAPKAEHVREILDKLRAVRAVRLDPAAGDRVHPDRLRLLAREGRITPAYAIERYTPLRRRAILVATLLDLERRLTDAALGMADRLIGASFTRGKNARERTYTATSRDVGRLMRLLHGTAAAVEAALRDGADVAAAIDHAVGLERLVRSAPQAAAIADLAEEDPLVRAADRWQTLRKFAPLLLEAIGFRAARVHDRTVAALEALREHYRSGKRELPRNVPMPFKMEWRKLVVGTGGKVDRRLFETALFAHVRNKLRSGDVWVERSDGYRRFDSYLLPLTEAAPIAAGLGLPATADEWLAAKADEVDWRLRRLAHRLPHGKLEGVILRDGRLSIAPVRAAKSAEADALADEIGTLMPRVRVTELLHEVARETGFLSCFTNFRTGRPCENENALLAVILADATNLGLARMAEASQGITRDQLVWTKDAYVRDETCKAALARLVDAHHALPIAALWGDGTTSAAEHEAPFVLDGLLHHGSSLVIAEHYADTGGSTDAVHFLCDALGFRFCPRLRDFPDRRLACVEPSSRYPELKGVMGGRIKIELIREHWGDILRLVASLKAGAVAPSAMLKKLAAYERQNRLDRALRECGRLVRTGFMIDWLETPALRRRCHAGLNKSEQRHALASQVCTYRQGRLADCSREALEFRASGLNLVIAAIVYWNSTYTADAVAHLRSSGAAAPDSLLAHTSPVGWEHIGFSGDFLWDRAAVPLAARRPLNLTRERTAA